MFFMVQWALMTSLDPRYSLANLIYIGYRDKPSAALRVTSRRSEDRKKQKTERNVFQCYIFGSKNAGKSALLYSLLGRCACEPIAIIRVPELVSLSFNLSACEI
jgi:Ras family protein T1